MSKDAIIITIVIVSILTLICIISICFIYKKSENAKWYDALIPFYGIYKYFNYCHLPFITFFIPVANIIVLLCSTSRIAKRFRMKRYMHYIIIFIPFIILPYIAFSKLQDKEKILHIDYIENNKDIDKLEKKLEVQDNDIFNTQVIKTDELILTDTEEELRYDDNLVLEEEVYSVEEIKPMDNLEEIIELKDEEIIFDLNYQKIEDIEDDLKANESKEKMLEKDIIDFKELEKSSEAIAFGGEQQIEHTTEAKHEDLKCSRCGSSLIGANGFCPGCGMKL